MPRIVEVTYERVKNLGNYQSERMGVVVACEPAEAERAMAVAKCFVWDSLGLPVSEAMRLLAQEAGPLLNSGPTMRAAACEFGDCPEQYGDMAAWCQACIDAELDPDWEREPSSPTGDDVDHDRQENV